MADPVETFAQALKDSERLKAVRILIGPENLSSREAPRSIVVFPSGGVYRPPENKDNLTDEALTIECHIWAKSYAELWSIRRVLVLAAFDYRQTQTEVHVEHDRVDFDESPDTTRDGRGCVVFFTLLAPIEHESLDEYDGIGWIDSALLTADGGVGDGTTTTVDE